MMNEVEVVEASSISSEGTLGPVAKQIYDEGDEVHFTLRDRIRTRLSFM